jgi:hypothetical protein
VSGFDMEGCWSFVIGLGRCGGGGGGLRESVLVTLRIARHLYANATGAVTV